MNIWQCTWKTIIYYLIKLVFWCVVFHVFFSFKSVFISIDIILFFIYRFVEIPFGVSCIYCFLKYIASIDQFLGVILNVFRVNSRWNEIAKMGFSASYDGPQGVGKTRCLVYDAFVMQKTKYRRLKFDTYVDAPAGLELEEEFDRGIQEKFVRFKARYESVVEYKQHPEYIDLLYSNFGIYQKGKRARELKREHFTQEERIFESNIKVGAELDNMFPNVLRKKKDASEDDQRVNLVDEYVGLDRQYTDGTLLSDTHRTKSVFISFRDCMHIKYHILEHKYIYTPKLIKKIYNRLGDKYYKKLDKLLDEYIKEKKDMYEYIRAARKYKRRRAVLILLQKNIRAIGFTKIYYLLEQGAAGFSRPGKDVKMFVLANDVPYYYDDRGLQKDYLPLGYRQLEKPEEKEKKKPGRPKKKNNASDQKEAS